jgi:hypothetical protein
MDEKYKKAIELINKEEYEAALIYLRKASQEGNMDAFITMSKLYKEGLGVKKNYEKAYKILEKCILKGSVEAEIEIADYYLNGYYVELNSQKGIALLKEHLDYHPLAKLAYGKYLETKMRTKSDIDNITRIYLEAIELDNNKKEINQAISLLTLDGIREEIEILNNKCEEKGTKIKRLLWKEIFLWSLNIFVVSAIFFWWPALSTNAKRQEEKRYLKKLKESIETLDERLIFIKSILQS